MKHLITFILFIGFTQFGLSQTIDPGLKDCIEGNYTWTDNRGNKHHIQLLTSLVMEYTGYIYEGDSKTYIGDAFVMVGKWGVDENTINIFTGKFKKGKEKYSKEESEYYAYHYQNSAYKGAYNLDQGTIVFMGATYSKDSGPCSQTRLKEHEANREGQSEGISKTVNYDNGRIVKDEYLDLLNTLAEDSKSLHFKNMVNEMNANQDDFAQGRNIAMQFGTISQQDMDAYNMFENISQGIAIGKFIYNELSNALTPEQEAARKYIQGLYTELNAVYKEVSFVPYFKAYDEGVLDYLSKKEEMINQYETATATKRLLYLAYWYQSEPYMTIEQLQNKANEIESLKNSNGTEYIVGLIEQKAKSFEKKEFMAITNKEYGFKPAYARLKMNEANYYAANGNKSKADEIRKTIDYDVNNFDAFKLLDESFSSKDYHGSIAYYEQVKEIIRINENGNNFFMFYKNIPNITFNHDGVWRHEATYLLALGVLSNLRVGNISQAEEELLFLKEYNENHRKSNEEFAARSARKKSGKFTDVERQTSYGQCLAIEKAVESILFSKKGKYEEANKSITESIKLLNDNPLMNKYYNAWIELLKFEAEIIAGNFSVAKRTAIGLKSRTYTANQEWVKLFTNEDYQYQMAYMKFKQKQYQSCINQLKILEAANPKSKRVLLLKLDTYKALGDIENSIKTENQLIKN